MNCLYSEHYCYIKIHRFSGSGLLGTIYHKCRNNSNFIHKANYTALEIHDTWNFKIFKTRTGSESQTALMPSVMVA